MKLTGKGNGTHGIVLDSSHGLTVSYMLQVVVYDAAGDVGVPAAGTLQIKGALDASMPTENIGTAIDLTDRTEWLAVVPGSFYHRLEVVCASLTADYTFDVRVVATVSG